MIIVKVTSTVRVVLRGPSSPVHTRWAATLQSEVIILPTENHPEHFTPPTFRHNYLDNFYFRPCHSENNYHSYVAKTSNLPFSVSLAMLHYITLTIWTTKHISNHHNAAIAETDMKTHRETTTSLLPVCLTALHFRDNLSGLGDLENISRNYRDSGEERI